MKAQTEYQKFVAELAPHFPGVLWHSTSDGKWSVSTKGFQPAILSAGGWIEGIKWLGGCELHLCIGDRTIIIVEKKTVEEAVQELKSKTVNLIESLSNLTSHTSNGGNAMTQQQDIAHTMTDQFIKDLSARVPSIKWEQTDKTTKLSDGKYLNLTDGDNELWTTAIKWAGGSYIIFVRDTKIVGEFKGVSTDNGNDPFSEKFRDILIDVIRNNSFLDNPEVNKQIRESIEEVVDTKGSVGVIVRKTMDVKALAEWLQSPD